MAGLVKNDEELKEINDELEADANIQPEPDEAELESGFDLEIVDPSVYGDSKPQALIDAELKLADLEAQNVAREASEGRDAATAANMVAIKQMQETLAKGITVNQGPATPAPNLFDQDAHRAKYNKNLYNDPAKETEEFIAPYMMELNSKIDSVNTRADRNASKANMLENDDSRNFYGKHKEEVDQIMLKLPSSPDVYQKALASIRSVHMDEIVAEKVAEEIAKLQTVPGAKPPLTNIGKPSAPAVRQKTQITPGMQTYMHEMKMKGIGNEDWLLDRAKELKKAGQIVN